MKYVNTTVSLITHAELFSKHWQPSEIIQLIMTNFLMSIFNVSDCMLVGY